MNRSPIFRTLLFCLIIIMGLTVAQAQTGNLLTNPGFENPFEPVPGSAGSMVAQGWTAWSVETGEGQPPEYYPATDTTNGMLKPRIHSGSDAQQYFTFFAPHTGGVYQQVTGVAAGDELTFSIYVYVWESSGDDVDASDGSGDLSVQVGIDPTGGTDATSSAIVWSTPLSVVDQYAQHTVAATAAGDSVTVFVRSNVNKVAMNNTVYLDDAELVVTGTGGVVPEITEQVTEAMTMEAAEPTDVMVVTEAATPETMPEVTAAIEASPEATEVATMATVEVSPMEVVTEESSQAATTEVTEAVIATDTPTPAPTVAIPTDTPEPPTSTPSPEPPTATPTDVPPTATPSPSPTLNTTVFPLMFQYTVVRGDTVGKLATRYGSTVEAIIIANQLNSDAYIYETQILMIPVVALPTATPTATPITPTTVPPTNLSPTEVPPTVVPATATETAIPVLPANTATTETQSQAQNVVPPPSTPTVIVSTYTVAYGDTLSSIASRFGLATMDLARVNQIVNPNLIRIGQVLNIPASGNPTLVPTTANTATATSTATTVAPTATPQPHLYQVQRGDNLYSISIKLNVPISVLIEANGIYNANRIYVGQILIVP